LSRHRNKRRCRYDSKGIPVRAAAATRNAGNENDDDGEEFDAEYIYAWVDVCRNFAPLDGMGYVTVRVVNRNSMNAVDTRGLFVKPADLRMPSSLSQEALQRTVRTHVVV
jgi:hypothetical protein